MDKETICSIAQFYFFKEPDKYKTEAYYCTQKGKVKGILTLTNNLLLFDPIRCDDNAAFNKDLLRF